MFKAFTALLALTTSVTALPNRVTNKPLPNPTRTVGGSVGTTRLVDPPVLTAFIPRGIPSHPNPTRSVGYEVGTTRDVESPVLTAVVPRADAAPSAFNMYVTP
jgi:hypothetical protein